MLQPYLNDRGAVRPRWLSCKSRRLWSDGELPAMLQKIASSEQDERAAEDRATREEDRCNLRRRRKKAVAQPQVRTGLFNGTDLAG
jgi:hypothetical protein